MFVRLLDLIAEAMDLQVLCGDIRNTFVQAYTNEKIYAKVGAEFGSRVYFVALITRAQYGLASITERFRTLLADFPRSLGLSPSRYDRDVWTTFRGEKDGFDYICTHINHFKIIAKDTDK